MDLDSDEDLAEARSRYPLMWWILDAFLLPFTVPYYIFLTLYRIYNEFKYKNRLSSKVVVITGASSGLGEALAHIFYASGCKVILAARRKDELDRVRREILEKHYTASTHPPVIMPLDLSKLKTLPDIINQILDICGHIDILVNNGGLSVRADVLSTSIAVDIKIMQVNYFGTVALTRAVLPSMIKRKCGRIVFISSIQGKIALPYRSAYSASKHAVQAFSDSLRAEIARYGVRVTCISPGYIRTSLSLNALTADGTPYGRLDRNTARGINPEEMAEEILKAILCDEKDVILSKLQPRIAYWLRFFCPSIYFWAMEKIAENERRKLK